MPIRLSDRIDRIKPSPTIAASARAAELKAEGKPILTLTTGEPDFDTPDHVKQAASAAMDAGQTKYTAVDGTRELKLAVQAKFRRENGLDYALDEILVSTGAKQVIFNAILATVQVGDEVIVPTPAWVSYPDMVKLAGGTPVEILCSEETGFKPTPERIAAAITPQTRVLMMNSPSNPTGAVLSAEEWQAIGDVLAEHDDIYVICDDIYEHINFTGKPFATLAQVCPELKDRVLTVNGVSKSYAMTGWRIGYGAGPKPLIAAMKKLQSQSTTNASSISQAAAAAALNGGMNTVEEMRQAFLRRRDMLVERLRAMPGLSVSVPDGAFYLFVGVGGLLGKVTKGGDRLADEDDVLSYFLEQGNVAMVGGAGFGMSPYMRISYAASDAELSEAADRIEALIAELS